MAELLPLFPLTTVLFPEMLLPLHIFEPRYRLLVRRCMDDDRPFGVVLIRSGQEVGASAEPHTIVVRGGRRFAVEQAIPDTEPYLVGRVSYLDEREGDGALPRAAVAVEAYGQYLVAVMAVTDDARGDRAIVDELATVPPREAAYRIAASLAVDAGERQRLLELASDAERLEAEKNLLERETMLLRDLLVRLRAHGEGRVALN
jgi:uncharacterized protein